MKITIEPETDAEKKLEVFQKPWVREGCMRFGLSGIGPQSESCPTGEFGFLHGDTIGVKGDIARLLAHLEAQSSQQAAVNGVLQANDILAQAMRHRQIEQELLANRNGLKLRRE